MHKNKAKTVSFFAFPQIIGGYLSVFLPNRSVFIESLNVSAARKVQIKESFIKLNKEVQIHLKIRIFAVTSRLKKTSTKGVPATLLRKQCLFDQDSLCKCFRENSGEIQQKFRKASVKIQGKL
jgi:hypothetical protein